MFALPVVSIIFAGFVRAVRTGTVPPASTITPAPVLHKRFDSNFVGYVLFDDGDTSTLECKPPYTYTHTDGYAGCVESLGDLGTYCAGTTAYYSGGGGSLECANACVTDFIYNSFDDTSPFWMVDCATRSSAYHVLRMSSSDIAAALATETVELPTIIITTPGPKETVTITPTPTSSTESPVPTTPQTKPKKNNGAIIGGAVAGSLIFVGLAIASAFFFAKRRKAQKSSNQAGVQPQMNHDQPVAMAPSPMSPGPFSPQPYSPQPSSPQPYSPQPGSVSPPPAYAQEKAAAVSVERKPAQYEYRAPEAGVGMQAPTTQWHEMPGHSSQPQGMPPQGLQPQTMPPQGRSELG